MKRIYAGLFIALALSALAFYSSWQAELFAKEITSALETAAEAVQNGDHAAARESLAAGAERCDEMRSRMGAFLRTEDFTELEASLRAADAFLEREAVEEACAEIRRAQVGAKDLEKLAGRFI